MKNSFCRSSLFRVGVALALFGQSALFGCTSAMQRAEQHATDVCAAKGKQPYIVDSQVKESVWHGQTASLELNCIDTKNLVHTSDSFGVELLADVDTKGAAIIKVVPGSIGANAGLKHADIVIEYADRSIDTAAALQAAVSNTPTGARVLIKLHRNQQEVAVTAQF